MAELLTAIEADAKQPEAARSGVYRTGFLVLDDVLEGGLRAGHLTLVGGPPGVGKTVATLQWARNMALAGHPVTYVCYEHDERALFARILQMETGLLPQGDRPRQSGEIRRALRAVIRGQRSLQEEVAGNLPLRAACARAAKYQHRLSLVRGTPRVSLADLEAMAEGGSGDRAVLFVDYLQKVALPGAASIEDRITLVAERLKEIALAHDVAVIAVVSGDDDVLVERRSRIEHMRGGAALAYEADVVLMLNQKSLATSKVHIAYDSVKADAFKHWVVVSVEKNRDGVTGADLEFRKDFGFYRFDPLGGFVTERLVDDRMGNE